MKDDKSINFDQRTGDAYGVAPAPDGKPLTGLEPLILNPTPDLVLFERGEAHVGLIGTGRRVFIEHKVKDVSAGLWLGRLYGSLNTTVSPVGPLRLRGRTSDILRVINEFVELASRRAGKDNGKDEQSTTVHFDTPITIEPRCGKLPIFTVTSDTWERIPGPDQLSREAARAQLPEWADSWQEFIRPTPTGSIAWKTLGGIAGESTLA